MSQELGISQRLQSLALVISLNFVILSVSTPTLGFARVWVEHLKSGQVNLLSSNCAELKAELDALIEWTHSRGSDAISPKVECDQNPNLISVDIRELIPPSIKQIYGIFPICDGPNCFNTALLDAQLLKYPRHTRSHEWRTHLDRCKLRASLEPPRPGDLVAIRGRDASNGFFEIHGFTHIGQLSCSKNGMTPDSACLLEPEAHVLSLYDFKDKPECRGPDLDKIPEECETFLSYYDCSSVTKNFDSPMLLEKAEQTISCSAMQGGAAQFQRIATLIELVESTFQNYSRTEVKTKTTLSSLSNQMQYLNFQNANTTDAFTESSCPICHAVSSGDFLAVKSLVENDKLDINQRDALGRSPIYLAARHNKKDIVQYLLQKGADLGTKTNRGDTVLHAAAYSGDAEILNQLDAYPIASRLAKTRNFSGKNPLNIACLNGKLSSTLSLIALKTDIKNLDINLNTILHDAVVGGNIAVVQAVITAGAELYAKNSSGLTALELAKKYSRNNLILYLEAISTSH